MARRSISPWDPTKRARLVYLDQPLYQSGVFNDEALTGNQLLLFKTQRNQAEPFVGGTAGAPAIRQTAMSYLHTNMESAGVLANPRLYVCTGFGIVFRQVVGAADNVNPVGTPPADQFVQQDADAIITSDVLVSIRRLLFGQTTAGVNGGSHFAFKISGKPYLEMPLYQLPIPYGLGGAANYQQIGLIAPGATGASVYAPILRGRIYSIDDLQILIPSQQEFWVEINLDTTLPTLVAELRLWSIILGVLGRESM